MIEILIMIAVVKAFAKRAKEKNFNKTLWGFIGAASYYVPVLLMGLWIFPNMVLNGSVQISSEGAYMVMSIVINLITGVICCGIAYSVVCNLKPNVKVIKEDERILDDEFYAGVKEG